MQLSTKAILICCISTQIFTAHGKPKHYLIETEDNDVEDIKAPIKDNVDDPSANEVGTDGGVMKGPIEDEADDPNANEDGTDYQDSEDEDAEAETETDAEAETETDAEEEAESEPAKKESKFESKNFAKNTTVAKKPPKGGDYAGRKRL